MPAPRQAQIAEAPERSTLPAGRNLLFLREEELRLAQDLLFFGYRDFTAGADEILAELDMGRAHHRVLHFVGRRPGITVGELLGILAITKQSLGRVLQPLVEDGYVIQTPGRDRPPPAPAGADRQGRGAGTPAVRAAARDGDAGLPRGRARRRWKASAASCAA